VQLCSSLATTSRSLVSSSNRVANGHQTINISSTFASTLEPFSRIEKTRDDNGADFAKASFEDDSVGRQIVRALQVHRPRNGRDAAQPADCSNARRNALLSNGRLAESVWLHLPLC
jgi:hypothetical protein